MFKKKPRLVRFNGTFVVLREEIMYSKIFHVSAIKTRNAI